MMHIWFMNCAFKNWIWSDQVQYSRKSFVPVILFVLSSFPLNSLCERIFVSFWNKPSTCTQTSLNLTTMIYFNKIQEWNTFILCPSCYYIVIFFFSLIDKTRLENSVCVIWRNRFFFFVYLTSLETCLWGGWRETQPEREKDAQHTSLLWV